MILRRLFSLLILFSAIGVTACGNYSAQKTTPRDPQVVTSPDRVSLMLAEAADKASNALETLAAVEQSKSPGVSVQPINNAPSELMRAMTITWLGPTEGLLKRIADRAGYTYLTIGDEPPLPLTVNIDAENMPVIDILRDIGLQLGARADVKVDGNRKMVELHYVPVTGLGR